MVLLDQPEVGRALTAPPLSTSAGAVVHRPSVWASLRRFARRHRALITVLGTLAVTAILAFVLAGQRDEFATALSSASLAILALAALLQVVALVSRSEAWHRCICAAGGTVDRRVLYRASSMGYMGSVLNSQLGVVARIAALRRSAPGDCPAVSTLVAAEFPILAVEATLAALTSFTLVGPLGLPWWLPLICFAVFVTLSTGLRHLALREGRELWKGLAVLRSLHGGRRLVGWVLVAVFAQIFRNWLLLHAVGVDASFFDAIAVLILGHDGVAAVAAAGVLTTVTGTVGGVSFVAWGGLDHLRARRRSRAAAVTAT